MDNHVEALKAKHAALELAIMEENSRVVSNETLINNLKKQKLKIKEELEALSKKSE